MKRKIRALILLSIAVVALQCPLRVFSQVSVPSTNSLISSPNPENVPELTVKVVEAALTAIEENPDIDEAVKGLLRSKYQEAIKALNNAGSHSAKAEEYREAMTQAPVKTTDIRAQLKDLPPARSFEEVKQPNSFDELQQELNGKRSSLAVLSEELMTVTTQLSDGEQRPSDISVRIPDAQRELSEVRQQIESEDFTNDNLSTGRLADRFLLQAREAELLRELEMLMQEQLSMSVRRIFLQAKEDLLTRQVENVSTAVAAYEESLSKSVTKQSQDITALAGNLKSKFPESHPAHVIADEVQKFADDLAESVRDKAIISAATADSSENLQRLVQQHEGIKKQLELGQPGREMATVLLKLRDLLDRRVSELAQEPKWPTLSQTRLAAVLVDSAIDRQHEIQEEFANQSSNVFEELMVARGKVLNMLREQYLELLPDLATLETERKLYTDKVHEVHADFTQQLFWMKIPPPSASKPLARLRVDCCGFLVQSTCKNSSNPCESCINKPLTSISLSS